MIRLGEAGYVWHVSRRGGGSRPNDRMTNAECETQDDAAAPRSRPGDWPFVIPSFVIAPSGLLPIRSSPLPPALESSPTGGPRRAARRERIRPRGSGFAIRYSTFDIRHWRSFPPRRLRPDSPRVEGTPCRSHLSPIARAILSLGLDGRSGHSASTAPSRAGPGAATADETMAYACPSQHLPCFRHNLDLTPAIAPTWAAARGFFVP